MDTAVVNSMPVQNVGEQLRRDTVLWRYLDAAKLFDFFENSTLFFCRADHFSDKFEGAFTPSLRAVSPDYTRIFAYKTKAYEYEKKVRVIIDRTRGPAGPDPRQPGIVVPIDADRLLRSIVISPDAPPWFENLVRQSAQRYGIRVPVRRSKLATAPI